MKPHNALGVDRIAFFSDAVIAIAITLLVIELKLPEGVNDQSDLWSLLIKIFPKLASYVLSFSVIALIWEAHHRMFTVIERYDRTLIWLNTIFLLFVAFLPFPTAIYGDAPNNPQAIIFYNATIAIIGFSRAGLWSYVSRNRRLIDKTMKQSLIRAEFLRAVLIPAVFVVTMPIAVVAPSIVPFCWALVIPLSFIARKRLDD